VVSASDSVLVNNARSSSYNIFADVNGNGVVDATDVSIVRSRIGTSQP
jgi:Dockerin type I domain